MSDSSTSVRRSSNGRLGSSRLLEVLIAFQKGDFSVRLQGERTGEAGKIADTLNEIIELSDKTARELDRVSRVVGKEGKITHRAAVPAAVGSCRPPTVPQVKRPFSTC